MLYSFNYVITTDCQSRLTMSNGKQSTKSYGIYHLDNSNWSYVKLPTIESSSSQGVLHGVHSSWSEHYHDCSETKANCSIQYSFQALVANAEHIEAFR